jgi:multiple sugar transport system permease protein
MVGSRRRRFRFGLRAAVAATLLWTLLPFYWMVATSLTPQRDLLRFPMALFPATPTLERFRVIFFGGGTNALGATLSGVAQQFRHGLVNSALVASVTCAIAVGFGALSGYAFARLRFPFQRPMLLLAIAMLMLPPIATVIPLYFMLRQIGLLNTRAGLIVVYSSQAVVYVLWVMNGYYRSIPRELEEAARVDGCTRFGGLLRVVLPLARSGLVATGLLVLITAWNEFTYALILVNDPAAKTAPVILTEFSSQFQIDYGMTMTAAILVALPPVALALVFQRYIVRGLTSGGVKG